MALKHFLDTGNLPGNILELSVVKKIDTYRFLVDDHSGLAELNLTENPFHAKVINIGTKSSYLILPLLMAKSCKPKRSSNL